MEVKLDKRYAVAATAAQAWAVLSDIRATASCMPGAQITEQIDATHFRGTVRSKVGPATMQFDGQIELLAVDAASREIRLLGKGADKSGSSAAMDLSARIEPGDAAGNVVLVGHAVVTVGGKLAQFGNRLLVPASDALLSQFADRFRIAAAAMADEGPPSELPATREALATSTSESTITLMVQAGQAPGTPLPAAHPASPPEEPKPLNLLGLLWTMLRNAFRGLFGRPR